MSKNIDETLHFDIFPSKRIEALFDALHGLAIFACWLNSLDSVYKLALSAAILAIWRLNKQRHQATPVQLSYTGEKGWEISSDGSRYQTAVILETTVITSAVVFLHYMTGNRFNHILLIPKDSLPENDFRRLIVRLKLAGCRQNR